MDAEADRDLADRRAQDIGAALLAYYRSVGERSMRELPIYNAALDFAAVGFRAHGPMALGIVATPWFMNLVLAPLHASGDETRPGAVVARRLPAGVFDFTVAALDGFGRIETCSLLSPMFDFADQASVTAAAEAALAAVLDDVDTAAPRAPAGIDRRRFLRGSLSGAAP